MKNIKKITTIALCSLGLFFNINACSSKTEHLFKQDGFVIMLKESNKLSYIIETLNEKIKEGKHSFLYDGDVDFYFIYSSKPLKCESGKCSTDFDENKDGWVMLTNKWKEASEGVYISNKKTGSYFSDISYKDVPGSPKTSGEALRLRVDLDKGEEYAAGEFTSKEAALEWAYNMVEVFKAKN